MIAMLINTRLKCCRHHITTNQTPLLRALSTVELRKYYKLLDVDKNSTTKEIKSSFLRLSKIYHPDNKDTGSHLKFVQLKEAYDAVKDGPPAIKYSETTSSSGGPSPYSPYSPFSSPKPPSSTTSSYSNYDFYSDIRYQSQFRERQRAAYRMGYDFGGPYARSSSPWEDLLKDRAYRRQKEGQAGPKNLRSSSLVNLTILFSAIAWLVIYSGFVTLLDYKEYSRDKSSSEKAREYDNYLSLEEARRRRLAFEARQISFKDSDSANSATNTNKRTARQVYVKQVSEDNKQRPQDGDVNNTTTRTSTSSDQNMATPPGEPAPAKT